MATHILGIRHHGPGSARRVRERLRTLRPDLILVEGPPEAEELLGQIAREGMKPPVALLAYEPTSPRNAVFYPFAVFSPEWQAMYYAATEGVELHFFDLPLIYRLASTQEKDEEQAEGQAEETGDSSSAEAPTPTEGIPQPEDPPQRAPRGQVQPLRRTRSRRGRRSEPLTPSMPSLRSTAYRTERLGGISVWRAVPVGKRSSRQ